MSNPTAGGAPIPPGLVRCPACGEYRGMTPVRYLDWDEPLDPSELGDEVEVGCLCEGITCRRCGKNKMPRPISNSYDPEANAIRHHPSFSYMRPCDECRSSGKERGSRHREV